MKKLAILMLFVCSTAAYGQDLNRWKGKGNPSAVVREVTHAETTFRVTVHFRTYYQATQTLPIVCPGSFYTACLQGASPTTPPSLLTGCTSVSYFDTPIVGDPVIKRIEEWHCVGTSQCQNAEGWIRDHGGLEIVATGVGGSTTGCTPK